MGDSGTNVYSEGVIGATRLELSVEINASASRVWKAFVEEIGQWWPADFHCVAGADQMKLEAWPGGRMWEEGASGAGLLWAHVTTIEPGKSMQFVSYLAPPFGGPGMAFVRYNFDEEGGQTTVHLTNDVFGYLGDEAKMSEDVEQGWRYLLEGGLKTHVEGQG